jgi:aminocarboxymuconate-semialdehyde decarboxylase
MSAIPTVDVHAHVLFPEVDRLVADQPGFAAARAIDAETFGAEAGRVNAAQLAQIAPLLTNLEARLEVMDRSRVDIQLVSPSSLHHHDWADEPLARQIARTVNERTAETCAARPDRLIGVGQVPLQHPGAAVQELTFLMTELGLKGVVITTSAGPRKLSDPALEPFWARAAELEALVFIHPWGCTLGPRLDEHYLANTVGQPVETTLALSQLIFAGVLDRHPGLRLLAAHGGGYLPFAIGRSDHAWSVRPDANRPKRAPSEYLREIWFDSLVYQPRALESLVAAAGGDQVMLGTDYPFDMGVTDPIERLEAADLDAKTKTAIRGGTACRLLGCGPA